MNKVYIYSLSDPRTNEIRYIGRTISPIKRYQRHIRNAKSNDHIYHSAIWIRTLLSLELKPVYSTIEECDDTSWEERERYWIKFYRERFDLTNISDGGKHVSSYGFKGKKHSQESIEKMKKARIGVSINQNDKNHKRKNSLRKTLDGKKIPVVQYSFDGTFIKNWESAVDAGRELGLAYSNINRVCKGFGYSCGKYIWKYKKEDING